MNYLPRNKTRYPERRRLVVIVLLFIFFSLFFSITRGFWVRVFSPVWNSDNFFSNLIRTKVEMLRDKDTLINENLLLREEVGSLKLQLIGQELAESRERVFRELIGRDERPGEIIASVLTHPPQSPYDLLLIDAGELEGVTSQSKVALLEGPLLGVVTEVSGSNSKVRLYSSAGEETPAILEKDNTAVVLEGRGGGNFRIKVPREISVEVGDRIVSADVGYVLVAVVESVDVAPTDAYQEVLAKSPANIFSVRLVKILP